MEESVVFCEKIALLRKEKGLSQLEVAEKLNVSRQAISRWEVGAAMPSTDNLKYLGELYDVPVDVLLNDGQDLLAWQEEQQKREQEPSDGLPETEHRAASRPSGKRKWVVAAIAAAALTIGIAFGIWIGMAASPSTTKNDDAPIEELKKDRVDLQDETQFSIGW